jgi:hypothetical protein
LELSAFVCREQLIFQELFEVPADTSSIICPTADTVIRHSNISNSAKLRRWTQQAQ